ncbi:MAG: YezD family protein [Candidatus Adiutrix sp.]|jgi:hypothetical protein|nr:YezD family protein [Candidatus Adiutrix sp.]
MSRPAAADNKAYAAAVVMDGALKVLQSTFHGQINLVVQNYRLVQVERNENFSPEELAHAREVFLNHDSRYQTALKLKIKEALNGLEFGQVVIFIKKGQVTRIERLIKERFSDLTGVGGDGI